MMMMLISFLLQVGIGNNCYLTYPCVFELQLKEEKRGKEYQRDGRCCYRLPLLRISQRLCLPSSHSSDESVLNDVNDEVEEAALVISLAISSAALALFEASLVISLTLSLV